MAKVILIGLEYPTNMFFPQERFPGAGGVQEGGEKAGEWGYSMYCGMSGILLSSKTENTWTTLVFLPQPPVQIAKHTEAQSTAPYTSHITEIHCNFSVHQRKVTAHLCTSTEAGSCEGVKRSSSAVKITGTREHAADVPCGGT